MRGAREQRCVPAASPTRALPVSQGVHQQHQRLPQLRVRPARAAAPRAARACRAALPPAAAAAP